MSIASVTDLIQCLTRYPLLEPAQRDELDWILKARFTDPRILAKELVLREWLTPFQVNQLFQGHITELMLGSYVLLERLTEGGIGQLFKARHLHMKRVVALQVVRPELLKDPRAVERFYSEIQAVSQLSHQHLVASYDAGPIADTHFFAMEYVEGLDLERQVQNGGPLAIDQASEFIRQTSVGLQHAFERGLVHHDLRPSNLLLARSLAAGPPTANSDRKPRSDSSGTACIKVRNLGLTLIRQHTKNTRLLVGTAADQSPPLPDYLAPERAGGAPGDVRSELYSLGCTFYFLLTGRPPFPGGSAEEKIHRHQTEVPASVESLRPEVPPALASLVARLLAKEPTERYAFPREVARALGAEPVDPVDSAIAPALPIGPRAPADFTASPPKTAGRTARTKARPRWFGLAGAGVAATIVLLSCFALFRGNGSQVATPTREEANDISIMVQANQPWQDTQIDVNAGEAVALLATGWWRGGPRKEGCSPEGHSKQPADRNLVHNANAMALIGWVSGEGAPFVIGAHKVYSPKISGRLFVQANDLEVKDNSGQIQLEITGGQATTRPAVLWQVGYGHYKPGIKQVENFRLLPYWPQAGCWQPGPDRPYNQFGYLFMGPDGSGHTGPNHQFAVVRRWLVPRDGVIAVSGTITHGQKDGDGVSARLVSSRLGELAKPWLVHNTKVETNLPRIEVRRGDVLDAVVDCRGNDSADTFSWPLTARWSEK